jgi:predicted esterase
MLRVPGSFKLPPLTLAFTLSALLPMLGCGEGAELADFREGSAAIKPATTSVAVSDDVRDDAAGDRASAQSLPTDAQGLLSSSIYCNQAPPTGAKLASPPPTYTGGTCPSLVPGKNALKSTGHNRSFLLVVPKDLKPEEVLPVVFLWHWLGGSADSFLRKGEVQAAVDSQRFLAVIPEAKSDMIFKWPFNVTDGAARQEEEFKFFDDMLSCVSAQFNVNRNCVSSAGVSAGALFTDQLAAARSQYLASAISLSGGVGEPGSGLVKPWGNPSHKLPMLVLWGGLLDICIVINFNTASRNLEDALEKEGNFFLECVHNCKHGEPPMDTPPAGLSKYSSMWRFVFDHPFWLAPGESPYKTSGIPSGAGFPSWCGIGKGGSRIRTGSCPAPGC